MLALVNSVGHYDYCFVYMVVLYLFVGAWCCGFGVCGDVSCFGGCCFGGGLIVVYGLCHCFDSWFVAPVVLALWFVVVFAIVCWFVGNVGICGVVCYDNRCVLLVFAKFGGDICFFLLVFGFGVL